jgi:hypothetical protein
LGFSWHHLPVRLLNCYGAYLERNGGSLVHDFADTAKVATTGTNNTATNNLINPPVITPPYEDNPANGPIYPSYVPKTDSDGNDIAGIRLPELTVPLATYTGWALRSGVWANDGCEASGQYIPFKATKAERVAAGDPRPSVEERYQSYTQVRRCAVWLSLASDAMALLNLGLRSKIFSPGEHRDRDSYARGAPWSDWWRPRSHFNMSASRFVNSGGVR